MEMLKHTLTPHRHLQRAPEAQDIWTLFSNKVYLEDVVGFFGTVNFYKYLAVMTIKKKDIWRDEACANTAGV